MTEKLKILALPAALLAQVTLIPYWVDNPFKPNLTIFFVVLLALRNRSSWGVAWSFGFGLLTDCFSGIYFGLSGFTYLLLYLFLRDVADNLYTDNDLLILLAVFCGSVGAGLLTLLLLILFSSAEGIYLELLSALLPHAIADTVAALVLLRFVPRPEREAAA